MILHRVLFVKNNAFFINMSSLFQNANECFCGNSLTRSVRKSDNDCLTQCRGDRSQGCGGSWRVAVYRNYNYKKSMLKMTFCFARKHTLKFTVNLHDKKKACVFFRIPDLTLFCDNQQPYKNEFFKNI